MAESDRLMSAGAALGLEPLLLDALMPLEPSSGGYIADEEQYRSLNVTPIRQADRIRQGGLRVARAGEVVGPQGEDLPETDKAVLDRLERESRIALAVGSDAMEGTFEYSGAYSLALGQQARVSYFAKTQDEPELLAASRDLYSKIVERWRAYGAAEVTSFNAALNGSGGRYYTVVRHESRAAWGGRQLFLARVAKFILLESPSSGDTGITSGGFLGDFAPGLVIGSTMPEADGREGLVPSGMYAEGLIQRVS